MGRNTQPGKRGDASGIGGQLGSYVKMRGPSPEVDKGGLVVDCISARLMRVRINTNKRPGGLLFLIERQLGSTLANNLKQNVTCTSQPKKNKQNTRSFDGTVLK